MWIYRCWWKDRTGCQRPSGDYCRIGSDLEDFEELDVLLIAAEYFVNELLSGGTSGIGIIDGIHVVGDHVFQREFAKSVGAIQVQRDDPVYGSQDIFAAIQNVGEEKR